MKKVLILLSMLMLLVVLASAQTIKVNTPVGGETYKVGDKIHVTWTATGVSGKVRIIMRKGDDSSGQELAEVAVTPSAYDYTVPQSVEGGSYFIRVRKDNVSGKSGTFTIKKTLIDPGDLGSLIEKLMVIHWGKNPDFPIPPKPDPCLSCPIRFNLADIWQMLRNAGIQGNVRLELFNGGLKILDLGQHNLSSRWQLSGPVKIGSEQTGQLIRGTQAFKLVIKNSAGQILGQGNIKLQQDLAVR